MRENEWFVCYRGKGKFHISPVGRNGWVATAIFVVLVTLSGLALIPLDDTGYELAGTIAYIIAVLIGSLAFIRFAYVKSEMINLDEIDAEGPRRKGVRP